MAKNIGGGPGKKTTGETKAKRAPAARRRTVKTGAASDAAPALAPAETAARRPAAPAVAATPSDDEVARRAYEIYLQRGATDGSHLEDWYEAERQLKGRS